MDTSDCPTERELRAFGLGDVSIDAFDRLARHVETCEQCERVLGRIEGGGDELVSDLRCLDERRNVGSTSFVPAALIEAVRSLGGGSATNERPERVVVDPGRRLARSLGEDGHCRLDRFDLVEELGVGSFGHVFRAYDTELDRTVAVKVQRGGHFDGEEDARRFLHEARTAARLDHPGIVSLYETGRTADGVCYLVTEYIEGETLERRLVAGPFDPAAAAELVARVAAALHHAHEQGVVHRDVKPSNILLDAQGRPHVADLGLAKRETDEGTLTLDGQVMGTPSYMSPEQARGDSHDVDARTDVYSLGVILYELLTGERPFQGNRRMLLLQVLEDEPRPPRRLNEHVPRDLQTICLKAMAKSPSRRYRTARELADDLERFAAGEPIAARATGPLERFVRWCRRYPVAVALFLAVSLGSVVGFAYLSWLTEELVRQTALDGARMEADTLQEVHGFYNDVVANVKSKAVRVTPDYTRSVDAVPLPATFMIDLGNRLGDKEVRLRVRFFSDHSWRPGGGVRDEFERDAFVRLRAALADGETSPAHHEFTVADGARHLRYARGLTMEKNCVECHNGNKKSPKRDWKEGELGGVLEIVRPLDRDTERVRTGMRGTFALMGGIVGLLLLVALLPATTRRVRKARAS